VDGFKLWSTLAVVHGLRLQPQPDMILASGPPWSPVFAASLVARIRRVPLVADFRDPWVWEFRRHGDLQSRIQYWTTRHLERLVLRWASAVTVTTGRFQQALLGRRPTAAGKTFLLRNGFDPEMLIAKPGPRGRLALLYAGTIYMNRNPIPLFDGLAALLSEPGVDRAKVSLKLVGNCSRWQEHSVADLARDRGLSDIVEVRGPVSGAEVRELTLRANVIVNFAQGQPEQVPAKLYEQIASHRHGLLFAEPDSESAMLIEDCPRIRRVDDDDAQILGELRRLYGTLVSEGVEPALPVADGTNAHRREAVNEAYVRLLEGLIHQ
jgi:glycosyltransferase involved in cell wall biosynthesis